MKERSQTMNVGDIIYNPAWSLDAGHWIDEYEVVALTDDSISIKHVATHKRQGTTKVRMPAAGVIQRYGKDIRVYLARPFEERIQNKIEDMKWFCQQLAKST